jgi:hypothetical protein
MIKKIKVQQTIGTPPPSLLEDNRNPCALEACYRHNPIVSPERPSTTEKPLSEVGREERSGGYLNWKLVKS